MERLLVVRRYLNYLEKTSDALIVVVNPIKGLINTGSLKCENSKNCLRNDANEWLTHFTSLIFGPFNHFFFNIIDKNLLVIWANKSN